MSNEGPTFKDIGGINGVLKQLEQEVLCHLSPRDPLRVGGGRPVAGILLYGLPGCGKTTLVLAMANEIGVPFYRIPSTEGSTVENMRDLFKEAYKNAPSIILVELDAIASEREVEQIVTYMDHYRHASYDDFEGECSGIRSKYVPVIAATNRLDEVSQALRQSGRFDFEIELGVPDEIGRFEILSIHVKKLNVKSNTELMKIARCTPGFLGADLKYLADEAAMKAFYRTKGCERIDKWQRQPWSEEEMDGICICMCDFEEAIKSVEPFFKREGFASIPITKWDDVGGLESLREEFKIHIVKRIKKPVDYEELGFGSGILLCGPLGSGKTLIAQAVANEAGAYFIHIKAVALELEYAQERDKLMIRKLFTRARLWSPCILFFDEMERLADQHAQPILNQLFIELGDADRRRGVYIIGAANRSKKEVVSTMVDMLRQNRFGKLWEVEQLAAGERGCILKSLARDRPVAADVDMDAIAHACDGFTRSDLLDLMNNAAMAVLDEGCTPLIIQKSHFEAALKEMEATH